MTDFQPIALTLDRRLIAHPRAYHLRRMRAGLWLYLALLAQRPAAADTFEVEPAAIGKEMGLPEGTVRSWLGHLRKGGYLEAMRLNGTVRVTIKHVAARESASATPAATQTERFFTVAKLQRALGESGSVEALEAALRLYSDDVIKLALAGTLAVPETQIRRSRIALFLYLVKRHALET